MEVSGLKNKLVGQLVDENYVHAYVLFYFGIRFEEYSSFTLEQACRDRGLIGIANPPARSRIAVDFLSG